MRLDSQWLSVPAAAKLLGRSSRAVHRAIERGSLPAQRIPGAHPRVAACVVAELVAASYKPAQPTAKLRSVAPCKDISRRLAEPSKAG